MIIIPNMIYVLSLALQLAAGLLLVGNISTSKESILRTYCQKHSAIVFEENGALADYNDLKDTIRASYINKTAFSYLCIGYLVSVWGEAAEGRFLSFILILFVAVLLFAIATWIAKKNSEEPIKITLSDIPLTGGVQYSILENKGTRETDS